MGNTPAPATPDADLIRLCIQHGVHLATFNAIGGNALADEPDPLRDAYMASVQAIGDARPETMAGVLAKACIAKGEAYTSNERNDPACRPRINGRGTW